MARPKKNNADYFSHDNDMRNSDKLKAVRKRYKIEGYGIYNMMLEKLAEAKDLTLRYNELNLELWAGDFEIETELLSEMIEYFIRIELLTRLDDLIFSEKQIERLSGLFQKRKQPILIVSAPETPETESLSGDNPQTKLNKTKLNNSLKEDEGLMKDFSIDACRLDQESEDFQIMDTSIRLYQGFSKAFPKNLDLPSVKKIDWIPPVRKLIKEKRYPPERVLELAAWAVMDNNPWRPYIMDTNSLERFFEKAKEKYHAAKNKT
jgi:hypothetical protein